MVSQSDKIVFSITKIPSEMELAPRYTPLFTMLIIFKLFYTAETVANMPINIVLRLEGFMGF